MHTRFIPIEAAIEEWLSMTDYKGSVDRSYIKKLANVMARKFTFQDQLVHKIKLLEIDNHKIDLPENLQKIEQIAFKGGDRKVLMSEIVEWQTQKGGCDLNITLSCPECSKATGCECGSQEMIFDVDRDFMMSNPQHFSGGLTKYYSRHVGATDQTYGMPVSNHYPDFILIKPATNDFHNVDMHVGGCLNLDRKFLANCPVAYTIERGEYMRFNMEKGQILLSYMEYLVDENGYRYIPDEENLLEAITWYIEQKMLYREARRTKDKLLFQLSKAAKAEKLEAMGRAREKLRTPSEDSWATFLTNNFNKILRPDLNAFKSTSRDPYVSAMGQYTNHR